MTTVTEDRNFIEYVINQHLLEKSIDWISVYLEPEDVFSKDQLREWANDNGMIEEENE